MVMATVQRERGSLGKGRHGGRDAGRGRRGKRKDKEKKNEGGYSLGFKSRTRRTGLPPSAGCVVFFFQPSSSPKRILPFSPFPLASLLSPPLPRLQWPHRPFFSSLGRILAGVRGKRCPKVTARMDQIQDPRVVILGGWEEKRRIGESSLSSNDSPGFIRLMRCSEIRLTGTIYGISCFSNICWNKITSRLLHS